MITTYLHCREFICSWRSRASTFFIRLAGVPFFTLVWRGHSVSVFRDIGFTRGIDGMATGSHLLRCIGLDTSTQEHLERGTVTFGLGQVARRRRLRTLSLHVSRSGIMRDQSQIVPELGIEFGMSSKASNNLMELTESRADARASVAHLEH